MISRKQVTQAEITEALMGGATVVTANKRLANATLQKFEQANIEKGLDAWSTPCVFPWDVWLQNIWEEAVVSGVMFGTVSEPALLLTPQQELQVWKGIIAEKTDNPLLQINGTARQAQHAWQLMQAWQLELDTQQFNHNSDSAEYFKWATAFEQICEDENWLPAVRLMDVLLSDVLRTDVLQRNPAIGGLTLTNELILFGFDELTPQQQQFLSALVDAGCNVSWLFLEGLSGKSVKVGCSDSRSEADIAARWVRQCMSDHPGARIGLVVPELQSKRNVVIQSLDRVLLPQTLSPTEQQIERPYNVSLGLPLSSYPIIEVALQLISFLSPTISLQNAGMILRSPFIRGWQQEASARALLDACLRKDVGESEISLKTIRYHASKKDKDKNTKETNTKGSACPQLVKNIDAWTEVVKKNSYKQSAAPWAEKIAVLLKAFGWSDGRALSSEEYQQTEAWRDLLISFSTLETVTKEMTASTAVSLLCSMAQDRTYQPQTSDLPIQVLGVLESAEMQFDFLWIMGLHDGIWPPVPHANPFIPISMQRDAGLPHSSEDKELQVTRRTTQRLLSSALSEVIVSYPKRDGDNELRVSSLIDDLEEAYFEEAGQSEAVQNKTDQNKIEQNRINLSAATTWIEKTHDSAILELIEADPAPAISNVATRGGSSILKHQANCPFRAFAELRLGARALENAGIGLNAMEKGKLIHTILEKTWEKLVTQEALLAMEASNLNKLVRDITNEAVENIAWRFPQTFTRRYKIIESERLCLRVIQWLEFEKQRASFKVIAREEKIQVEIVDGVQITVVIDRIDELEDARKLVVDYKTGNVKTGQWFGERPEDPQLPLYSMLAEGMLVEGNIAAVAFAQVRANEMAFKGVAEEAGLLPGVGSFEKIKYTDKETWPEVLHEWKQTIKGLAEDYRNGIATVNPKNKKNLLTCEQTYCKLKSLCRINELTIQDNVSTDLSSADMLATGNASTDMVSTEEGNL